MSHITNDSQRTENKEISDCMERNARFNQEWVEYEGWDGETIGYWSEDIRTYTCGPSIKLSASQDKCPKCGKIFTY